MRKTIVSLLILMAMMFTSVSFAAEVIPIGDQVPLPAVDFIPVPCEEVGLVSNLKFGNHNEQVTILQEILNYAGYDVGNVDGWFGFKTRSAVKALQSSIGVKADGVVGPLTRDAMLEICTSYTSQS